MRPRFILPGALLALGCAAWLWTSRAVSLPEYGTVPAFQLGDERGATVRRDDLLGKVHVVDFMFTSCTTACPLLTAEMARLQRDLRDKDLGMRVGLVSISVDPERDTAERLRAFAARSGVDASNWRFLRGDETEVKRVVVDGMKQAIEKEPAKKAQGEVDDFTILHGTRFVLLDKDARIRGFYDANDAPSMKTLRDDIAALVDGRVTVAREAGLSR